MTGVYGTQPYGVTRHVSCTPGDQKAAFSKVAKCEIEIKLQFYKGLWKLLAMIPTKNKRPITCAVPVCLYSFLFHRRCLHCDSLAVHRLCLPGPYITLPHVGESTSYTEDAFARFSRSSRLPRAVVFIMCICWES